jgi:hypothetical protein
MDQTVHPKLINHLQPADRLKASADGSIVITLARLTLTILQAQASEAGSIVHYRGGNRAHYNSGPQTDQLSGQSQNSLSGQKNTLQAGLIVATIAVRLVATKESRLSCFKTAPHHHQTNYHAHTENKRCNVRKLTLQFSHLTLV